MKALKACDLSAELSMKFGSERLEKPLRLMLEVRNSELLPVLPVQGLGVARGLGVRIYGFGGLRV